MWKCFWDKGKNFKKGQKNKRKKNQIRPGHKGENTNGHTVKNVPHIEIQISENNQAGDNCNFFQNYFFL